MDNTNKEDGVLNKVLLERDLLLDEYEKLCCSIDEISLYKDSLLDILAIHRCTKDPFESNMVINEYKLTEMKQPYMVVGNVSLLSVFNFGTIFRENPSFQKDGIIRPLNYKAKRLYYGEKRSSFDFYTCKIGCRKNMPHYSITTERGQNFNGGKSMFQDFARTFKINKFKSVEDFFGLTDPNVQRIIFNIANSEKKDAG